MGAILGLGVTHYPPLAGQDEAHGAHPQARHAGSRSSRALPPTGRLAGADASESTARIRAERGEARTAKRSSQNSATRDAVWTSSRRTSSWSGATTSTRTSGRHHSALLRAGLRVDRAPAVVGGALAEGEERVGRVERRHVRLQGSSRRREIAGDGLPRRGPRRVLCVPAAPSSARPRLHEHLAVPRLRPAGLPLPGRAVLDQLLRPQGHLQQGGVSSFADLPTEAQLDLPSPAPWRCFDLGRATRA